MSGAEHRLDQCPCPLCASLRRVHTVLVGADPRGAFYSEGVSRLRSLYLDLLDLREGVPPVLPAPPSFLAGRGAVQLGTGPDTSSRGAEGETGPPPEAEGDSSNLGQKQDSRTAPPPGEEGEERKNKASEPRTEVSEKKKQTERSRARKKKKKKESRANSQSPDKKREQEKPSPKKSPDPTPEEREDKKERKVREKTPEKVGDKTEPKLVAVKEESGPSADYQGPSPESVQEKEADESPEAKEGEREESCPRERKRDSRARARSSGRKRDRKTRSRSRRRQRDRSLTPEDKGRRGIELVPHPSSEPRGSRPSEPAGPPPGQWTPWASSSWNWKRGAGKGKTKRDRNADIRRWGTDGSRKKLREAQNRR